MRSEAPSDLIWSVNCLVQLMVQCNVLRVTESMYSGWLGQGAALLYANQLGILDALCPTPEGVAEAYQEDQEGLEGTVPHKCILQAQATCLAKLYIRL